MAPNIRHQAVEVPQSSEPALVSCHRRSSQRRRRRFNWNYPKHQIAMSLDIFSLLTLDSNPLRTAFTAYKSTNPVQVPSDKEVDESGSASPVHKVARLDSDSDSASAYRSRTAGGSGSVSEETEPKKRGAVRMTITGPSCECIKHVDVIL